MTKTKLIIDPKRKFKVYYQLKCSMRSVALAQHVAYTRSSLQCNDNVYTPTRVMFKHHINVFLPRIWKSYIYYKHQDENYSWDNLFSHAVSHEYMHKALMELEGIEASSWLDKLPEIYKLNKRELVRSGIPIKEE